MELDAEWRATIGESTDGFACLCVPELNGPIVARAQEPSAIVIEAHVSYGFSMALIRADAFFMRKHIPNFACSVMRRREGQMSSLREEFDPLHSLIMTAPCVNPLLWDEAIMFLGSQIARRFNKALQGGPVHVLPVAMVDRRCLESHCFSALIFGLLQAFLSILLKLLDDCLLFSGHLRNLLSELLHALVVGPGTFEVCVAHVALFLTLGLQLPSPLLARLTIAIGLPLRSHERS